MNLDIQQVTMQIVPMACGIFRDIVLLFMFRFMWKSMISKKTEVYDQLFSLGAAAVLMAGNLAGVSAAVRFPVVGLCIVLYCTLCRKDSAEKAVFMLLLLYNIHALSYLIANCFYNLLTKFWQDTPNVSSPDFLKRIYIQTAWALVLHMLVYALLVFLFMLLLQKVWAGNREMGLRDMLFLSVLNVVGIIFAYMVMGISVIKLETEVFFLFDQRKDALWKVPLMAALLLTGELSSIFVWQKYRSLMARKEEVLVYEARLKQIKNRLDEAYSFYGDIRVLKHDIRNHISNIRNLHAKGEIEAAETYIEKLNQVLDRMDYKYSTGNTVCDVIINDKYRICTREGIRFSSDFEFYDRAGVASFDMGIILSNLLDNAIESCRKVEEDGRFISLKSKVKGAFVLLEIQNPYRGEIMLSEEDGLPLSSKLPEKDSLQAHGLGLRSCKKIAEKYMGILKIELKDGVFIAVVMLQYSQNSEAIP